MAGFSEEQKAFIRQLVWELVPLIMSGHVDACPWGKKMSRFIWVGVGIGITLSLLGITTIPALWNLLLAAAGGGKGPT